MLADLDSRDGGGNRFELAADFRRRVHFEIENVLMRRPAGQENHDDRFVRTADAGLGFGLEELGQRQAAKAQRADFEKVATRDSVAERLFRAIDRQHKRLSSFTRALAGSRHSWWSLLSLVLVQCLVKLRFRQTGQSLPLWPWRC